MFIIILYKKVITVDKIIHDPKHNQKVEEQPKLRHPEKQRNPDNPIQKKPDWIRVKAPVSQGFKKTKEIVKTHDLKTVCEEASCPNIGECWEKGHATMMIMGKICTRACAFCNVTTGKPVDLNFFEPYNVAETVKKLGLKHVVITSVDRDDLPDGGASHFAETITAIRKRNPETTIEVLTPDFKHKDGALEIVVKARPDVYNHNIETVPRLYQTTRRGANYFTSLKLLSRVKELDPTIFTKSGFMVGLGETDGELYQVMDDLRAADVDFLTAGQYLQPSVKHAKIDRFMPPEEFDKLADVARSKGFLMVSASPLTRSSYHADADFELLKKARSKKIQQKLTL